MTFLLLHLALLQVSFLSSCFADRTPYLRDQEYNAGHFGSYVTQTFKSNRDVEAPMLNFMRPFSKCDDGSLFFIAPRGLVAKSMPMILDNTGSPVWVSTNHSGEVYNLHVQQYRGEDFLTFWAGNDAVGGHGEGRYFMLDQSYNQRFSIEAANGYGADLHAFSITADNTALISVYSRVKIDFNNPFIPVESGWIWDSIIQELDLETGEAIFEWHASDHIDISETFAEMGEASRSNPWDGYHINSIEKDASGNYLLSLRHARCVVYVNGATGGIEWQLGGKSNSFEDLSGGEATTFLGQHDAHWTADHTSITVFDNQKDWLSQSDDHSKGKRIAINTVERTARLDAVFSDDQSRILSESQGSFQSLPNGHVLLGYGNNGAMIEFSAKGEPLCSAYFQPSSDFGTGTVQSYRNMKFNWTGMPTTLPDLVLDTSMLYFSWNGATEVDRWLLQHANFGEGEDMEELFQDAVVLPKQGFETEHNLLRRPHLQRFVRVVALGREGQQLGISRTVDIGELAVSDKDVGSVQQDSALGTDGMSEQEEDIDDQEEIDDIKLLAIAILSAVLSCVFVLWTVRSMTGMIGIQRVSMSLRNRLPSITSRQTFWTPLAETTEESHSMLYEESV